MSGGDGGYYPDDVLERLAAILPDWTLEEFVSACELARRGGGGFFQVTLTFKNGMVDQIDGSFSRKPRLDQSGLSRR